MRVIFSLMFLLCCTAKVNAQTVIVSAVSIEDIQPESSGYEEDKYIASMEWTIKNKNIKFGSEKIQIPIQVGTPDTIFHQNQYYNSSSIRRDTFLTKFIAGRSYEIMFNSCCDGFNLFDSSFQSTDKILVSFKKTKKIRNYILTYGDNEYVINSAFSDTLSIQGRSPMVSNNFTFSLKEIEFNKNRSYSLKNEYVVKRNVFACRFIPANVEITEIVIDGLKGKLEFK
jgi:hypothetical protein